MSLHIKVPNIGKIIIIIMTTIESSQIRSKLDPDLQLISESKLSKDFFIANHFSYSHNTSLQV